MPSIMLAWFMSCVVNQVVLPIKPVLAINDVCFPLIGADSILTLAR